MAQGKQMPKFERDPHISMIRYRDNCHIGGLSDDRGWTTDDFHELYEMI